ncbi:cell wall metabolism sensor histidine kinase WalK, partial [bacterium]|nr:cell wall metabolism sensor histidine kinase WalK [bacterium]
MSSKTSKTGLLWKLLPTYLAIAFLTLFALGIYTIKQMRKNYIQDVENSLEIQAALIKNMFSYKNTVDEFKDLKDIDVFCDALTTDIKARITIIDNSGQVLGDSQKNPETMDNHNSRPEVIEARKTGKGISRRYSATLDKEMIYLALPMENVPGTIRIVRISMPLEEVSDAFMKAYLHVAVGIMLIAIAAIFVSFYMVYRLNIPIKHLIISAQRFAAGDFNHRTIDVTNTKEFNALATAMNKMADKLKDRINVAARQTSELEGILSVMADAVLVVNKNEELIRFNNAAKTLFQLKSSGNYRKTVQETIRNVSLHKFVKKVIATGKIIEETIVLYDQEDIVLQAFGSPVVDEKNEIFGILIVLHDITKIYKLETMRKEFVANVSHELKSPITAIKGFVETLKDGAIENQETA